MFYDEPADTPYEISGILVREQNGNLCEFATVSPIAEALNKQLWFRRLHVAPQWRDLAEQIVRRSDV
jgi:hypothetical protein